MNLKVQVLSYMNDRISLNSATSVGVIRYAKEFLEAAIAVDDSIGMRSEYSIIPPTPVLFLLGHSMELSLKSYLIHKGVQNDTLKNRKIGHDLIKCLKMALTLGLTDVVSISEDDRDIIHILNKLYSCKQLEYCYIGCKEFPAFGNIKKIAVNLVNSVSLEVGYKEQLPIACY
jgi:hypothetical protein